MFLIEPAPPLDLELIQAYSQLDPVLIGHVLMWGCAGSELSPLTSGQRITGRAVTARSVGLDSTAVQKLIELLQPGDVAVVDQGGCQEASCWGGTLSLGAARRGALGLVLNGPITDVEEIIEQRFPVWSRGRTTMTTRMLGYGGAINIPVTCGQAAVCAGDLVVASDSGVAFLSPTVARALLGRIQEVCQRAGDFEQKVRAGGNLPEITGASAAVAARLLA